MERTSLRTVSIYRLGAVGNFGIAGSGGFTSLANDYTVLYQVFPYLPLKLVIAGLVETGNFGFVVVGILDVNSSILGSGYASPLAVCIRHQESFCLQGCSAIVAGAEKYLLANNLSGKTVVVYSNGCIITTCLGIVDGVAIPYVPCKGGATLCSNAVCSNDIVIFCRRRTVRSLLDKVVLGILGEVSRCVVGAPPAFCARVLVPNLYSGELDGIVAALKYGGGHFCLHILVVEGNSSRQPASGE